MDGHNGEQNGGPRKYGDIKVFSLAPEEYEDSFSKNICAILNGGMQLNPIIIKPFPDGDSDLHIDRTRGYDVFAVVPYTGNIAEQIYRMCLFADAAKSGGYAERLVFVWPKCYGDRGDRRTRARQPVNSLVIARSIQANGAWGVLTSGIHTETVGTTFNACKLGCENLQLEYVAANYIIRQYSGEVVVGSPDAGGAKRAEVLMKIIQAKRPDLEARLVVGHKVRDRTNKIEKFQLLGDVRDSDVIWVDDLGDTLGTMRKAIEASWDQGARNVRALMYHPTLGTGYEKNLAAITQQRDVEIVFGNSVPLKAMAQDCAQIRLIPLEPLFAQAIQNMNRNESISGLHDYKQIMALYDKCPDIYSHDPKYVQIGSTSAESDSARILVAQGHKS